MANEITLQFSGSLQNGAARDRLDIGGQLLIDQNAAGADGGIVAVATAATTISFARLATPGVCFLLNLDATNFVEYGPDNAGSLVKLGKLKPGEFAVFRLAAEVTLKAIADTAGCNVLAKCWND